MAFRLVRRIGKTVKAGDALLTRMGRSLGRKVQTRTISGTLAMHKATSKIQNPSVRRTAYKMSSGFAKAGLATGRFIQNRPRTSAGLAVGALAASKAKDIPLGAAIGRNDGKSSNKTAALLATKSPLLAAGYKYGRHTNRKRSKRSSLMRRSS